jgi:hypothetical protein
MATPTVSIAILRRELRASMGDRSKLSKLHSVLTDTINRSYGEEKVALVKFREEVKEALNCRVDNW